MSDASTPRPPDVSDIKESSEVRRYRRRRRIDIAVAIVLQVVGLALVSFAGWLVYPPVGFALGGLALIAFGIAAERERLRRQDR